MSFTTDNILDIVKSNPEEIVGILNAWHSLMPGFHAFQTICKDNGIKKPRKQAGQYKKSPRPISGYNVFTKAQKDNPDLEGVEFGKRAGMVGALWKIAKANGEDAKYMKQAAEENAENKLAVKLVETEEKKDEADAPVEVEVDKAAAKKAEKKAKAAAKKAEKKAKAAAKKPEPEQLPDDGDASEVDDDDVFIDDDSDSDDE
jgi:hypothetical protein